MTITYRQLTRQQRYQIQALLAADLSQAEIARQLGCHRCTISRELARCPSRHYLAKRAQTASDDRRSLAAKQTRYDPVLWRLICTGLKRYLSPEMLAHQRVLSCKYQPVRSIAGYAGTGSMADNGISTYNVLIAPADVNMALVHGGLGLMVANRYMIAPVLLISVADAVTGKAIRCMARVVI